MGFMVLFRNSWRDRELVLAALLGGLTGAAATLPVKFLAYPIINRLLEVDLRKLIIGADSLVVKVAACLGVIGPVEEAAKFLGVILALSIAGLLLRPAAIFMAAVSVGVGFSVAENLDYYHLFGPEVLFVRVMISSTGHAVFAGIFGLAGAQAIPRAHLGGRRKAGYEFLTMMAGLALAALAHGAFNAVAFSLGPDASIPLLATVLLLGVTILYGFWIRVLRLDVPAVPFTWNCPGCGTRRFGRERFCPACGSRVNEMPLFPVRE
jgi:RsiW-degrading membrane proteinase PrsW (M82 family)